MSESNRVSQLLSQMRQNQINETIKKARAVFKPCVNNNCQDATPNSLNIIPRQSDRLYYNVNSRCTIINGRTVGPESSRIKDVEAELIDCSTNPFNTSRRFAEFQPRVVPPVCPPSERNGNLPKSSTKCPLPNKFYFPSIV
jgi:hypothetical protein